MAETTDYYVTNTYYVKDPQVQDLIVCRNKEEIVEELKQYDSCNFRELITKYLNNKYKNFKLASSAGRDREFLIELNTEELVKLQSVKDHFYNEMADHIIDQTDKYGEYKFFDLFFANSAVKDNLLSIRKLLAAPPESISQEDWKLLYSFYKVKEIFEKEEEGAFYFKVILKPVRDEFYSIIRKVSYDGKQEFLPLTFKKVEQKFGMSFYYE